MFIASVEAIAIGNGAAVEREVASSAARERLACLSTAIPLQYNRYVQSFIKYFTEKNRAYTRRLLSEKQRYFPIFEHYLARYGLPDELKYLAIVESGLRPDAVSRMGAAGLWQFMPSTGRLYGLRQNRYVDERYDPHKATEAACRYLRDLYDRFGDWELALAAFNSGPGRVTRAIRRSGKRRFWEMYRYLPRETRSYLPQFVAIVYVMNYHPYHRLFPLRKFYMVKSDTVHINGGVGLRQLAESLSLCEKDLLRLNPSYRWGVLPSDGRRYVLRVPVHKKDALARQQTLLANAKAASTPILAKVEKQLKKGTVGKRRIRHRVRRGEALSIIAKRYGLSVSKIKRWNRLRSSRIYAGQRLTLWVKAGHHALSSPSRKKRSAPRSSRYASKSTSSDYYIVQRGDTLWSIAQSRSISVRQLKKLNKLRSNRIQPGQRLLLSAG